MQAKLEGDTRRQTPAPAEVQSRQQESEDRFRLMADSAPVMIWVTGADKRFEWVNRPWLEYTGRTMDEEIGSGWLDGVHAEDLERCSGIFHASFDARQPFTMDFRLRRHDGSHRWVLANGVPRTAADGSFHGYTGSCIDIHERRRGVSRWPSWCAMRSRTRSRRSTAASTGCSSICPTSR
jgi:PAS domain S-box-containing protein